MSNIHSLHGNKINNIEEIYKGDGINTCKWCGNTGWMHTFSNDGYFYSDAPCFCSFGDKVVEERRRKEALLNLDTLEEPKEAKE